MRLKNSKKTGKTHRQVAVTAAAITVQEIMATTDFSDESRAGVRYAMALAEKLNAAVSLLHVMELPSWLSGEELVVLARKDSEVSALVRQKLATLAKRKAKSEVAITSSVRTGKPFHEITTAAREAAADLIVIATHGCTGVKSALLGSTAERVVRHAPCPVLTVPALITFKRMGKTPPLKLRKIVVAIDFSSISKEALPWAAFLAAQFGADLILLHVIEKFPIDYLLGPDLMNHAMRLIKQAEADLDRMAVSLRKSTRVNVSVVVRDGAPFEEICHSARTLSADLIVLTTHGYTGLKHVLLGSTAERVVRHAPCPVLVVR